MKNKLLKIAAILVAALACTMLAVACGEDNPQDEKKYTLTYTYAADAGITGTAPAGGTYKAGEKITLAANTDLAKTGYLFDGWTDGANNYATGAEYTMPANAVTLTAKWKWVFADNCGYYKGAITFNLQRDYVMAVVSENKISFSESLKNTYPDEFTMTTDIVNGIYVAEFVKKNNENQSVIFTGTVTFSDDGFSLTVVTSGVVANTVTVEFVKKQTYNVTFDVGYTDADTIETQIVMDGEKATAPAAIEREGYDFLGWYVGNATEAYNFTTATVTADVALTAKWSQITEVTVTYNLNGASGDVPQSQTVAYNATITAPTSPTRTGFRFVGWTNSATGTTLFDFSNGVKRNMTLYAKWIKQYTITYAAAPDGATGNAPSAVTVDTGLYTLPVNPFTKTGWTFVGWKVGASNSLYAAGAEYTVNSNITITAVFGNVYTNSLSYPAVTLRDDGVATMVGDNVPYTYAKNGNTVTLSAEGVQIFSGEIDEQNKTYIYLDGMTFEFTANDNTTKLTLDGRGGATIGTTQCVYVVTSYNEFVLIVENAQYVCGIRTVNSNSFIDKKIVVNGTEYVFGTWYAVSYTLGDGVTGTAPSSVSDAINSSVTLDSGSGLSKTGYTFIGWKESAEGSKFIYAGGMTYVLVKNVELVPVWKADSEKAPLGDFVAANGSTVVYGNSTSTGATNTISVKYNENTNKIFYKATASIDAYGDLVINLYYTSSSYPASGPKDYAKNKISVSGNDNTKLIYLSWNSTTFLIEFGKKADETRTITITCGNTQVTWEEIKAST